MAMRYTVLECDNPGCEFASEQHWIVYDNEVSMEVDAFFSKDKATNKAAELNGDELLTSQTKRACWYCSEEEGHLPGCPGQNR